MQAGSGTTTEAGPPPLTADERAWLAAIPRLHAAVDKPFHAAQINLTRKKTMQLARVLSRCGAGLEKLGRPSDRLEAVYDLAASACKRYAKGVRCFSHAARLGDASGAVLAGTRDEKVRGRSISCGFAALGNGSNLMVDAEAKAQAIKTEVE
jgi:hypothetical protein